MLYKILNYFSSFFLSLQKWGSAYWFTHRFITFNIVLSFTLFMKTKSILFAILLLFVLYVASAFKDPGNPPAGNTGAPAETTCQKSGCHSGGSYTGNVSITGIPDTIAPGQTYTITLNHASNAVRAGFQITCLNASNVSAGTFTAGTGSSKTTTGGRQYVRQSTPKTLSAGTTSWTFTWQAPATISSNENITFYFSTLAANGNGNKSGDNVLLGTRQTILYQEPAVGINPNTANEIQIKLYPLPAKDYLLLTMPFAQGVLTLTNMQGNQVLYMELTAQNNIPVANLPRGLYIAQINANGKMLTQKIVLD